VNDGVFRMTDESSYLWLQATGFTSVMKAVIPPLRLIFTLKSGMQ